MGFAKTFFILITLSGDVWVGQWQKITMSQNRLTQNLIRNVIIPHHKSHTYVILRHGVKAQNNSLKPSQNEVCVRANHLYIDIIQVSNNTERMSFESIIIMNKVFGILFVILVLVSAPNWGTTFKDGKISPVQPQVLMLADKRVF